MPCSALLCPSWAGLGMAGHGETWGELAGAIALQALPETPQRPARAHAVGAVGAGLARCPADMITGAGNGITGGAGEGAGPGEWGGEVGLGGGGGRACDVATHEGGEPHAGRLLLPRFGGHASIARSCSLRGGRRWIASRAARTLAPRGKPPSLRDEKAGNR
jgi:hypothetical protein